MWSKSPAGTGTGEADVGSPFHYHFSGLRVTSDLHLPELVDCRSNAWDPDIRIVLETCTEAPAEYSHELVEGRFAIGIPTVASFLIHAGREIRIRRPATTRDDKLRPWLLGSALGALIHQRGGVPLHASGVAVNGGCAAFVGPSGAGKSTLCAHLAHRGYPVVSDDVLPVFQSASGILQTSTASSSLRLKADAVRAFVSEPERLHAQGEKYVLHRRPGPPTPFPLRYVYVLDDVHRSNHCGVVNATGTRGLKLLLDNVYRPQFAESLGCVGRTFALLAAMAEQVAVYRLLRPRTLPQMLEVLEFLETHWSGQGCDPFHDP